MKRIWGVECPDCKKRIFSFYVYDQKFCGCANETVVDGGREYLSYGWKNNRPRRIYWTKRDGDYRMMTAPIKKLKDRWPY